MDLKVKGLKLTPKRIPPSICIKEIIAVSAFVKNAFLLSVKVRLNPIPTVEKTLTDIGVVQGNMVIEFVPIGDTHVAKVQDSSLTQSPRTLDRPAIIVSKALHVSSDCCGVFAVSTWHEYRLNYSYK